MSHDGEPDSWMRRAGLPIVVGLVGGVLLLAIAELGVRAAGVEPGEWGAANHPGMVIDPLLGPSLRPGWSGQWYTKFAVAADEHGFRATGAPAPSGRAARIAFLGDSCTFGWGMDTDDTFVARLDARQRAEGTPGWALRNAAFPGGSAVVGMHVLRDRVLPLHPDVIVLAFGANNAFRLSLVSDVQRFRAYDLRRFLLRSRLYQVHGAWLARRIGPPPDPRDRGAVFQTSLGKLQRVAFADEFETAVRTMIADGRAAGARVVLLVLPRASGVSSEHAVEDAATGPVLEPRAPNAPATATELGLLESSCLDHRALADPVQSLHERRPSWHRVYPDDPAVRAGLADGARAYVRGDWSAAVARFTTMVDRAPDSPLARYDLGAAKVMAGDATGLRDLEDADRLACNVFLQYQVVLWKLGVELGVPVVDATLWFQAHDETPLFIDPAHPNHAGHAIIADALWPALRERGSRRQGDSS